MKASEAHEIDMTITAAMNQVADGPVPKSIYPKPMGEDAYCGMAGHFVQMVHRVTDTPDETFAR